MRSAAIKPPSLARRNSCSKTAYWPPLAPPPASESLSTRLSAEPTITAPPSASEIAFPDARRLRSRDVFRLVARVWPFIRPYRRHLVYLVPGNAAGSARRTYRAEPRAHFLRRRRPWRRLDARASVDASTCRSTPIGGPCSFTHASSAASCRSCGLTFLGFLFGYGIWILQRISNLFRVNLYTRMQELSVRFHSEEKIGDAIFRMFQDSAAIPNVIDGLIVQPLIFFPAAVGSILYLLWYDYADGADRRYPDAGELRTGVDVRKFVARRIHR